MSRHALVVELCRAIILVYLRVYVVIHILDTTYAAVIKLRSLFRGDVQLISHLNDFLNNFFIRKVVEENCI